MLNFSLIIEMEVHDFRIKIALILKPTISMDYIN